MPFVYSGKDSIIMKDASYNYEQRILYIEKTRDLLAELPDYCSEFLNDKLASDKFQPRTCYAYAADLTTFLHYLTLPGMLYANMPVMDITLEKLDQITYRTIADYLSYLTSYKTEEGQIRSNDTASKARKLASVRSLYGYLIKHHRIKNNPCIAVDTPKIKEKPIIRLSDQEQKSLYHTLESGQGLTRRQQKNNEYLKLRDNAILTLFFGTGIRVSELVGINITDINDVNNSIMVTRKGNKLQNVYLSSKVLDSLYLYIDSARAYFCPNDSEQALFLSQKKQRISVRGVQEMIKKYADGALGVGNKISPHKLRKTYGTNLYELTGDIYLTADALGHRNIQTTAEHYAAMSETRRKKASSYADDIIKNE